MGGTSWGSTSFAPEQGIDSGRWTIKMLPSGQSPVMLAAAGDVAPEAQTRPSAMPRREWNDALQRCMENARQLPFRLDHNL